MSQIFGISIHSKEDEGWLVVVQFESGAVIAPTRHIGRLNLDLTELLQHVSPQAYGEVLGKALFHSEIRDAFVDARARSQGKLHIRLLIEDMALRSLHWEWLCAPHTSEWSMLALDQSLPTAFYLPSGNRHVFEPITQTDLQALIMVANPQGLSDYNLASFDDQATVSGIQASLNTIPSTVLATTPDAAALPTLDNLAEYLTATPFNLLHLVCHGQVAKRSGDTVLYLADTDGQVAIVSATDLIDRLRIISHRPYLVYLSTCESASPKAEGALGGLAQRLVRDLGIPAVVAMTDLITIGTAKILDEKFYTRLQAHGEVDLALTEACAGLADQHDVTVPALYTRLRGQPLFSQTIQTTDKEKMMSDDLANKDKGQGNVQIGGVNFEGISGSISVGGSIDASVRAGGDIVGGDKIIQGSANATDPTPQQILNDALINWKQEIEALLVKLPQLNEYEKQEITDKADQLEAEAQKEDNADVGKIEYLMNSLSNMAPDILEVTVKTLQNPFAGMGLVLQKINDRIKLEREKKD